MRLTRTIVIGYVLSLTVAAASQPSAAQDSIAGLGPTGPVTKVAGGFQFTEGPAADRHGNLFFSDVRASRVHKVDSKGQLSVFREPSNRTNGNMFNSRGELVGCEQAGRIVAVSPDGKNVRVLAEQYEGKPFNAPNDLVIDRDGGVYFTDPHFGAVEPLPQGVTAVYYVSPEGKVARLIDDLKAPNGVILSPDEKTLYVIPSMQSEMMAYPVEAPGRLGKGRVFCTVKQAEGKSNGGGDGLTVDVKGNLYITTGLGIQVYDPAGKLLGIIAFPEQPANCTFGGPDGTTLYATARTSLYSVPMAVKGHVFPAGK